MIINTKFLEPRNFIVIGLLSLLFKAFFDFAKSKINGTGA